MSGAAADRHGAGRTLRIGVALYAASLLGLALSHTIAKAVLYGAFTKTIPFFRTPKMATNQGLLVTAATIHMSLLGPEGLESVAAHSMANTRALVEALTAIPSVSSAFDGERFHEAVIHLPQAAEGVLAKLAERGIFGGFDLSRHYPELGHALLICATETRTAEDIARYAEALHDILSAH